MAKRESAAPHVIMGGAIGELGHCTHCGQGCKLPGPTRIELVARFMKAFAAVHAECAPGWMEPIPKTPEEWIAGRDTGISSATIWSVMTGKPSPYEEYDVPKGLGDFGRCYRLVALFPEWRWWMRQVAERYPGWRPIIADWPDWEARYLAARKEGSIRE